MRKTIMSFVAMMVVTVLMLEKNQVKLKIMVLSAKPQLLWSMESVRRSSVKRAKKFS